MAEIVADCPRCNARSTTFDVQCANPQPASADWQGRHEIACVCRHCRRITVFLIETKGYNDYKAIYGLLSSSKLWAAAVSLNNWFRIITYVSLKDADAEPAPEFVPDPIKAAFSEGATCIAVQCWNAAGAMFRLAVDLTTKGMLPPEGAGDITSRQRRILAERMKWLFENRKIPSDLEPLSHALREDGNDGAHDGTLSEADALDLLDFSRALLERLFTEPKKLELAAERRRQRRQPPS